MFVKQRLIIFPQKLCQCFPSQYNFIVVLNYLKIQTKYTLGSSRIVLVKIERSLRQ